MDRARGDPSGDGWPRLWSSCGALCDAETLFMLPLVNALCLLKKACLFAMVLQSGVSPGEPWNGQ